MPRRFAPVPVLLLLASAGSCRQSAAPPLPTVDVSVLPASVRATVASARDAAAAAPDRAESVLRFGMVLQAHGQLRAALSCYERAHALDNQRFDTLYYWGHALAANGETEPAARRLREALARRPGSFPVALKLAEVTRDPQLARALAAKHPEAAPAHYWLGRAETGAAAIAAYEKALSLFPRYGPAQFALAAEYRRAGRAGDAREALRNYERDKTTVPPLDDPEGAALAELASSGPGLLRRAQRADAAGQPELALRLHDEALRQDPSLADAWINLISLRARLGQPAAAVEAAYREAVRLAPNRADAYYNFGVFCLQQQRWPEAQTAFGETVRLDPGNADAHLNLGSLAGRQGRLDDAAASFRLALAAQPGFAQARYHLGQIHAVRRDYRAARQEFSRAREQAAASGQTQLAGVIEQDLARLP